MARINRFSRRTPYEGQLYEYPVELLASTMDIAQKRYDQNKEIANTIQDFVIPSLPQDRELANKLQAEYASQVEGIVKEYSGDYSKASKKLEDLTRKIKKDFNPGGVANAISGNYLSYKDWIKQSQELVEKGKVLGEDLNIAHAYYMKEYKGIGNYDPIKGSYNIFNPDTLSEYVNPDTLIRSAYDSFKPEKIKIGRTVFQNGLQTDIVEEQEGISAGRLYPSFTNVLTSDPKYSNYVKQRAKFLGMDPEMVVNSIDQYAKQRAIDLSYMNTSTIQKSERDPLYLLREKQRLEDESNRVMLGDLMARFEYEPTVEAPKVKESTLSTDWKNLFKPKELVSTPYGFMPGMDYGKKNPAENKKLFDVLFTQDFIDKTNIDPDLAKEIWKDMVGTEDMARVYYKNYGTNSAWTKAFDDEFVRNYKNHEKNISRQQPISVKIESPEARESILRQLAGQLNNPNAVNVMKVGSNIEQRASAYGLTAAELLEDGKLKPNDVRYVMGGPGYGGAGFQVHTSKGTFLFLDNNMNRRSLSNEISGVFNQLFFDNKRISDGVMRAINPRTGEVQWAKIEKRLGRGQGRYTETLIAHPIMDMRGNQIQGQPFVTSTHDLLSGYAPQFEGAYGSGMSNSQQTLFTMFNYLKK